jgi:hypothetical protein
LVAALVVGLVAAIGGVVAFMASGQSQAAEVALLTEELAASEADVANLTLRIDQLANEKAAAEDGESAAILDAATWTYFSEELGLALADMSACASRSNDALNSSIEDWNLDQAGYYVDVGWTNRLINEATYVCNASYNRALALLDEIRRY